MKRSILCARWSGWTPPIRPATNESPPITWRKRWARTGSESVIRESAPTRANLIARHEGTDSSAGALLLSSHTDVVPVERSGWTREPFSGETPTVACGGAARLT